ncbi:MAG: nucleoside triphosphate pyrophosphohydrolase [Actinobacteria bacterium]|nr:nucleoside triphosphate pyrophosphohydrolase [Actinomycetota bacterium]
MPGRVEQRRRRSHARIVLVETSDALPGLLPFPAWDALATADVVLTRDPASHPAATHLYFAGVDLEALAPGELEGRFDLLQPGSPTERKLARGLMDAATARGAAVYLLGPGDEGFARLVGLEAAKLGDVEVEFVFLSQAPPGLELLRLVAVMRRLRDPDGGCPWDLEQDHGTLARHLVEETYELLDAIASGDDEHLQEELGDVLLQVVFHAQVAIDRGAFGIDDVATGIADKLVRRHPHVFADGDATTADEVQANWDQLKQDEKQRTGPFDGVPSGLPGLMLAEELQRKAAKLGFDWRDEREPADRIHQELAELADATTAEEREEELGDLLGAVVGLARHLHVEPEAAMRRAAAKFRTRFEDVLTRAAARGTDPADLDREAWLALWDEVKAGETGAGG